jgi:ketosteroid isomerase-like protein
MSDDDVEFVRRCFGVVARAFDAYWREPRSISRAMEANDLWPEWLELFALLDPEVEWKTLFLDTTFHGHEGIAHGWDDFLTWADHYTPSMEDADDIGDHRVLVEVTFAGKAKDGPPMSGTFFAVFTVRDGRLLRVDEHTTRAEALAARERLHG